MVRRKKTPSAPEEHQNGMTVKQGDGSGDEGVKKLSRKLEGCEEEESGDQGSEESNTKKNGDEIPNLSSTGSSSSAPIPSTSSSNPLGPNQTAAEGSHCLSYQWSQRCQGERCGEWGFCAGGVRPISFPGWVERRGLKVGAPEPGASDKDEAGSSQKKVRRQWESWSTEDKNTFFQGLYEHGKDFEAIQNNIALKYKKKGKPASMVKNKEQVRHFYYRTWHKISKYIDFSNVYSRVLKKSSQELYGLICYAELRKKVGGLMDDKNVAKLNELIQHGATTVRSKGRNLRIKVPMCRALKKLCDPDGVSDEEDQKPVRLPLKVPMELQPRSNHSWARVQSLAHNPRLRMMVELHRKVSSLIEFLKQKWAIQDHRIWKSLEERDALEAQQHPLGAGAGAGGALPVPGREQHADAAAGRGPRGALQGLLHRALAGEREVPGRGPGPARRPHPGHPGGPQGPREAGPRGWGRGEARRAESAVAEATDEAVTGGAADDKTRGPSSQPQNSPTPPHPPRAPAQKEGTTPALRWLLPAAGEQEQPGRGPVSGRPEATRGQGDASGQSLAPPAREGPRAGDACTKEDQAPEEGRSGRRAAGKEDAGGAGGAGGAGREAPAADPGGGLVHAQHGERHAGRALPHAGQAGKLQLEYEWLPVSRDDGPPHPSPRPRPRPATHRVLRCLLRLVSSEVNPKPVSAPPPSRHTATAGHRAVLLRHLAAEARAGGPVRHPAREGHGAGGAQSQLRAPPGLRPGGRAEPPRSLLAPGASGDADSSLFAVPTTLPPNSRHGKMFSPNKEAELAFRQQLHSFSMQSDLFLPKQRKFRNRHLRKPLVVQRTLLPRTTGDASQHVCSFSILSNSSIAGTGSFRPIQPSLQAAPARPPQSRSPELRHIQPALQYHRPGRQVGGHHSGQPVPRAGGPRRGRPPPGSGRGGAAGAQKGPPPQTPAAIIPAEAALDNGLSPLSPAGDADTLLSPPSVASLLDISLPGPPEEVLSQGEAASHISDSIIELAINSAHYGDSSSLSPAKLNGGDVSRSLPSPACSPQRSWIASPSHDPQWYPNESSDSTLSCLLSSLISPEKGRKMLTPSGPSSGTSLLGPSLLDSSSRDSFHSRGLPDVGEVDSQLACMMSESSVDYIARFNDLAQELSVSEPPPPPPGPAAAAEGGAGRRWGALAVSQRGPPEGRDPCIEEDLGGVASELA
ncbi:hypothetical protein ANANG_G00039950 [Anguilla anguilla]|uniref:Protein cramped-like n=1 Tax=Anguilla anguilla TaxID=7936 RepID=A0A9D3S3Z0_ANGAN|nr:hypothetical protein ANANG_G00039950 [Anguilla anguilla]